MKYVAKYAHVDAVKWLPNEMLMIDVMRELGIDKGRMSSRGIISIGCKMDIIIIKQEESTTFIQPGNYAVIRRDGSVVSESEEYFKARYEPMEES